MDPSGTPSGEPAAPPVAPAEPVTPTGSEPVTNPGTPGEQTIPYTRFQEVNDAKKAAEERATQLEQELEQARQQQPTPPAASTEDEIDPDVEKMLDGFAKKRGYLTQEELNAREAQVQLQKDVTDLTAKYKDTGIAFDDKAVYKFAQEQNLPIGSRAAWESAYFQLNKDAILDAERNKAIESYKTQGASSGERPGPSTAPKAPQEPQATGIRARVQAARAKIS